MADITTIKTRILNKYDLLDNYGSFTPLKGEICIVEIPTDTSESGLTPPAIGIKVGDGKNSFDKLNWIQAIAGDVAVGLKELTGVADIDAKIAALTSNRKLATIEELNDLNEDINSISTNIGTTSIGTEGTTITSAIKALQDTVGASGENSLGSQVADLKTDLTELQGRVTTVESDLNTVTTGLKARVTTLEGEMDVVQAATAGYNKDKTIGSDIQAAKESAAAAQSTANTNEEKITVLVGSDTNKSVRTIAAEETAKIVAGADEKYDTLKEIADWIKSDTTGAAEMANDITEMQNLLGIVEGNALPKTVDARIEEAIAAAEGKVTELANGAVKSNAEAIGNINTTLNAMNVTDTVNGVVTKVDQNNGKITVTHKKITMDEFDPNTTFIFDCGNASRDT